MNREDKMWKFYSNIMFRRLLDQPNYSISSLMIQKDRFLDFLYHYQNNIRSTLLKDLES